MALPMSCSWKHPTAATIVSGEACRTISASLFGKREGRLSLGTRDTVEAKRLHALKLVEIEERWSTPRQSQRPLASIRPARARRRR
ncbi:DUF6538 domain-containing protein [Tardiphaga robiniae]|uniref:DUF6538 domain-containing protein n=1 Tax=Tardiphaga robiniae TaxID=943830 RepID=UPI0035B56B84